MTHVQNVETIPALARAAILARHIEELALGGRFAGPAGQELIEALAAALAADLEAELSFQEGAGHV